MTSATLPGTCSAPPAAFDAYAAQYEDALQNGLRLSGEGPEYFARRRIAWTAHLLREHSIERVLDFGCGVGLGVPMLQEMLQSQAVWGFDPSASAIERAERELGCEQVCFSDTPTEIPAGEFDLAYCNGVFHHIDPADRSEALAIVWRALRPGGWFAFWENNPWNLGTRFVMRRIPFDHDAIVVSPPEANRLLKSAGFLPRRTDAWFLFPRSLSWLRSLEYFVHRIPLGAQYLVLAQKQAETVKEVPCR